MLDGLQPPRLAIHVDVRKVLLPHRSTERDEREVVLYQTFNSRVAAPYVADEQAVDPPPPEQALKIMIAAVPLVGRAHQQIAATLGAGRGHPTDEVEPERVVSAMQRQRNEQPDR